MKHLFLLLCNYLYKSLLNSNMVWHDRRTWLRVQSFLAAAETEIPLPRGRDCDDHTLTIIGVDIGAPVSRVSGLLGSIAVERRERVLS
jgi:hypothetical protein